ncbi:MAG: O-antigen ligase family protein [Marmoricola sp.]
MAAGRSAVALTSIGLATAMLVALASGAAAIGAALIVLVFGACLALAMRPSLGDVAVYCIVAFCFVISWDEANVGGLKPRLLLLFFGFSGLLVALSFRGGVRVPWWLHAYGLGAIVVTLLQVYFPIAKGYLDSRYATSAQGQSLGTRAGTLPSLLSLLENNYVVPMAIALACIYQPKALRWTIAAFVSGVAISGFVGFLGYEGLQSVASIFAPAPPVHFRAQGFTSHSLHLATSIVFAVPLAVWLAGQPGASRWAGRLGLAGLFLGIYASGSRGGAVAAPLALGLCAFLMPAVRQRLHIILTATGLFVGSVLLFVPGLLDGVLAATRLSGGTTAAVSDQGRGQILDQSILDINHSPLFGIGVRYIAEAHILYFGVLASGGAIFFAAYVLFNVGSINAAIQSMKVDRGLGGAIVATLFASLVYWTVADDFQVATVEIIYGFLIALLVKAQHQEESGPPDDGGSVPLAAHAGGVPTPA